MACLPVSPLRDALSADLTLLLHCRYLEGIYKNLQKSGVSLCLSELPVSDMLLSGQSIYGAVSSQ